jgi:GDP-4-dehydro-6-deoxy-D-mannose reductase
MSKIIVTGINGFVGQHLSKELIDNGNAVIGIGGPLNKKVGSLEVESYMELDLTKAEDTNKINFSGVDGVIHLAGLAAVGPSFEDPKRYLDVNLGIEVNLFQTALKQNIRPKFLIVSSGSLYDPRAALPLTEESSVSPNSPYAVSKLGQEQMSTYYEMRGFECLIARPFNHIGPGQGLGFIVPDLAEQIAEFKKGTTDKVLVGNLDAKRDYTDVRDIVRAYRLLLEKGRSGEIYNVCSGIARDGHEILAGLTKAARCTPKIERDASRIRPSDTPVIFGSHDKLTRDTGWQAKIPLQTTLSEVIESLA